MVWTSDMFLIATKESLEDKILPPQPAASWGTGVWPWAQPLVTSQPVWDTRDPMNEVNGMFKCSREGLKEVSLLGPFPSWAIPAHSQNLFLSLSPEGSSLQLVSHNTSLDVGLRIP